MSAYHCVSLHPGYQLFRRDHDSEATETARRLVEILLGGDLQLAKNRKAGDLMIFAALFCLPPEGHA